MAKLASPPAPAAARRGRALPDLHALETFVTVCESGSMAAAAQRLGVTQSAVSQAIRNLEAEYAAQLFDRGVRPVRPTRAGTLLLERADGLLAEARRMSEQVRRSVRADHEQIRLGCVDSFAATLGPALVRGLSGSTRQLQLWSGLTPGLNAQLRTRELDLAVCTELPEGDARIAGRMLFSESWVAVFPRGPAIGRLRDAKDLRALAAERPLIRYTRRSMIGQQVERLLRHLGVESPRRFEFDATDPLLSLVAAGLGWAISTPLCLWQSRAWLDQVQLAALPASQLGPRDFHLLCRDAEWSSTADAIVDITRTAMRHETLPALRRAMPGLPKGIVAFAGRDPGPTS